MRTKFSCGKRKMHLGRKLFNNGSVLPSASSKIAPTTDICSRKREAKQTWQERERERKKRERAGPRPSYDFSNFSLIRALNHLSVYLKDLEVSDLKIQNSKTERKITNFIT